MIFFYQYLMFTKIMQYLGNESKFRKKKSKIKINELSQKICTYRVMCLYNILRENLVFKNSLCILSFCLFWKSLDQWKKGGGRGGGGSRGLLSKKELFFPNLHIIIYTYIKKSRTKTLQTFEFSIIFLISQRK